MLKVMNKEMITNNEEVPPIDVKAIREGKGLTLKDISHQSRISVSVLDAIENRKFDSLPEPIYTRGFIRTYAQILEIDNDELLSAYNAHIAELELSQEQIEIKRTTEKSRARYTVFGAVIAILIVIFFIFIMTRDYHKEPITTTPPSSVTDEIKEVPLVEPQPEQETPGKQGEAVSPDTTGGSTAQAVTQDEPVPEKTMGDPHAGVSDEPTPPVQTPVMQSGDTATEQEKKYILEIEATEVTWLKIAEDLRPNEEVLMKPGEKITREASEKFIVYIGNAGGVNVSFQGKPLGPLGEHGKVIRLILPPKQGDIER